MTNSNERLNIESAMRTLSSDGPLAMLLKGFEPRREQQMMMRNVLEAYNDNHIALIEAGTGTGKSLAYLIPALLWAAETKERTVISTNTIPLQEQLLIKDIPLVEQTLQINVKTVLVKGMHNYLCLRKLEEAKQEYLLYTPKEAEELQKIDAWKDKSRDGSRSSLPFSTSAPVWDKVSAENDTCNRSDCPHYQQCFFFKARRQANDAQILIVNHHLLFADLVQRAETNNYKDQAVLPLYSRLILDEAHNIEDTATEYFATSINQIELLRLLARLAAEKGEKIHGLLPILKDKISNHFRNDNSKKIPSIINRLTIDLPGQRRDLSYCLQAFFNAFFDFTQTLQPSPKIGSEASPHNESKLRILSGHHTHPNWNNHLVPTTKDFALSLRKYSQSLTALIADVNELKNGTFEEQIKGVVFEIQGLSERLSHTSSLVENFIEETQPKTKVRWIESQPLKSMVNTTLVRAELDISKILNDHLFTKFETVILCSATLTTDRHFKFVRSRLGLSSESIQTRSIKEYIYDSPFNYEKQAILGIPLDIPDPSHPSFIQEASEKIWQALLSSQGNAFVLFTSYSMLKEVFQKLENRLRERKFHLLKQGDDDRQQLLNKFKNTPHSVLFGTDSFWEGVDVAGDALRCVIIVKLPFKVPSDPLIQARSEIIKAQGGDPFMDYSLPQAIVKFKQGFGRLIRNKNDRGCVICLDNRITTKKYGKLFLNSLPNCQRFCLSGNELAQQMGQFYRKTHYLTLS